jgi:outer membrane protein
MASSNLLDTFSIASRNDPVYQGQLSNYQSISQDIPEARSFLLPQLGLAAEVQRAQRDKSGSGRTHYSRSNYGLTLSQTIFDYSQFKQLAEAKLTVKAATFTLASQQQDLMVRTAEGYFGVLRAKALLNYTKQQVQSSLKQFNATRKRYKHGEATITDLNQAEGAYDLLLVDLSAVKINLNNQEQDLRKITAVKLSSLKKLKSHLPLINPNPNNINTWVTRASMQNLALLAARYTVQAVRQAIQVKRGDYIPTLDAVGSYSNEQKNFNHRDKAGNNNEYNKKASVGLDLDWSVYQGGLTNAQVDAAIADYQTSIENMREAYLEAQTEARKAFVGIIQGRLEVMNARAAVKTNTSALRNAEKGYIAGEQTVTDVLQVQNQLFTSQKQYVKDTYDYLINILLLKQAAGILSVKSLAIQNSWLQ